MNRTGTLRLFGAFLTWWGKTDSGKTGPSPVSSNSSNKDAVSALPSSIPESLRKDATEKGILSRTAISDSAVLDEVFGKPQVILDDVAVTNLPSPTKKESKFDVYTRSTSDFTSLVTPLGITGTGLGAGFGATEDKRLSVFSRRNSLRAFDGASMLTPKYDENGFPLDAEALSQKDAMRLRRDYLNSFKGTSMSYREHFLLADLDFDKDAMLFGNTREEFERNVSKLKNVIIEYTKWERKDNFYYYCTIALKLLTVWVLMECVHQVYDLRLLSSHYELFEEMTRCEIDNLETARHSCFEQAALEISKRRGGPSFEPVLAAMRKEKARLAQVAARGGYDETEAPRHPMDTTGEEQYKKEKEASERARELQRLRERVLGEKRGVLSTVLGFFGLRSAAQVALQDDDFVNLSYAASPTSIECVKNVRRIMLPRSEDYTQIVREEMIAYRKEKQCAALQTE